MGKKRGGRAPPSVETAPAEFRDNETLVCRRVHSSGTRGREHATRARARDRTVTAPFAGTVGFADIELGARIEDGDTVTTLDGLSRVEIEFSLPENFSGRASLAQRIVAISKAVRTESRIAIGSIIVGGLLLTLFLTPVLYDLLAGFSKPSSAIERALEAELTTGVAPPVAPTVGQPTLPMG